MKKYLFGLGAMLIGAGLMFVFTHTEVSAESERGKRADCETYPSHHHFYEYCKIQDLTCVSIRGQRAEADIEGGISCVKSG